MERLPSEKNRQNFCGTSTTSGKNINESTISATPAPNAITKYLQFLLYNVVATELAKVNFDFTVSAMFPNKPFVSTTTQPNTNLPSGSASELPAPFSMFNDIHDAIFLFIIIYNKVCAILTSNIYSNIQCILLLQRDKLYALIKIISLQMEEIDAEPVLCPSYSPQYEKEAPLVYSVYLFTGGLSFICTLTLLLVYTCNKKLRTHPNGILIHLMLSLCAFSLVYFLTGLSYAFKYVSVLDQIIRPNLSRTGIHCHSFSIPIYSCTFESTFIVFFTFSFLGWNFVWLYDLVKVFKQPMHTTDQFLSFYKMIVYISAFFIADFFFSIKESIYTMVFCCYYQGEYQGPTYTCFISIEAYKYTMSGVEILYLFTAAYTIYKYGRDSVISRFKKTGSKLQYFFRTQKCYFFLCAFCWILDITMLFVNSSKTRQIYAIIRSIEPTIMSLPWIMSIIRTVCGAKSARPQKEKGPLEEPLEDVEVQHNQSTEDAAMNKKTMDDAMRNEIVEYLLKGIRRSIISYTNPKVGSESIEEEDEGIFKRILKALFGRCIRGFDDEDEFKEYRRTVPSNLAAGNGQTLKCVNLVEKRTIIREAKREVSLAQYYALKQQVFKLSVDTNRMGNEFLFDDERASKIGELSSGVKFVSLGPKVFQNLRNLHSVDENDIISLFSVSNLLQKKLRVKLQSGKGGAFFVFPEDGRYLIKSINEEEYGVTKTILPDLYMHYLSYPSSFINPIYGCYALYLSESNEIEPQYFVLMKNVLDINRVSLPEKTEILCFDLKGSSAGRKTLKDPRKLLAGEIEESIQKQTLKDADFLLSFKKLDVTPIQSQCILEQLEKDANFFSKFMLIDYSLLLFVMNIPYRAYVSTRKGIACKTEYEKGTHTHELVLGEHQVSQGKTAIVIEERDRATNTIYRITNRKDVEEIKNIDDNLTIQESSKEANSFKQENSMSLGLDCDSPDKPKYNSKPSKLSKISKKSQANESIRRSVINFPNVIITENISKYSIGKEQVNEVDENPFSEHKIPKKEEELTEENQMVKKKLHFEKQVTYAKINEGIGITGTRTYDYDTEAIPEDFFASENPRAQVHIQTLLQQQDPTLQLVEQLVFDRKRGGFYKRQLRFGIIDYLTVRFPIKKHQLYTIRKRFERFIKGLYQNNPSVAAPAEYAERFLKCMQQIYQSQPFALLSVCTYSVSYNQQFSSITKQNKSNKTNMNRIWLLSVIFTMVLGVATDRTEMTHYPAEAFSYETIKNGGCVLYFFGLLYMFLGIMQVHRLYLGPCLQCMAKSKMFEEDTMMSTLRPLALTAPEYFMCLFSTVFGVTDIGISAFLGTNAFTACIERGVFIFLAGSLGEIDWFTGYREMITYAVTLLAISMCLLSNSIVMWNTIVMIIIYIAYWLFMQFNRVIEKKIKEAMANQKEEDPRLDDGEIVELHKVKRREITNTPESILDEKYKLDKGYVICRYKNIERKVLIKQIDGLNPKLGKFYNATNKILCALAHKKLREQIERATYNDSYKNSKVSISDTKSDELVREYNKPDEGEYKIYPVETARRQFAEPVPPTDRLNSKTPDLGTVEQTEIQRYRMIKSISSDTEYYDGTMNMQWRSLVWPKKESWFWNVFYVVMLPISALLYISIPNPRIPRGEEFNKLPLVYFVCLVWMGIFSYFVTWWLASLSLAFEISFLILPMIILPLGLLLRDFPHWLEFDRKIALLKKRLKGEAELKEKVDLLEAIGKNDKYAEELKTLLAELELRPHKEVILEHYSGPIFSLTIGSSITWLVYTIVKGDINLYSNSIWIQLLLLMSVILVKLVFITRAKFKTPRSLFYTHLVIYASYISLVMVVEYTTQYNLLFNYCAQMRYQCQQIQQHIHVMKIYKYNNQHKRCQEQQASDSCEQQVATAPCILHLKTCTISPKSEPHFFLLWRAKDSPPYPPVADSPSKWRSQTLIHQKGNQIRS
eukprot:TRINITY_DN827_c0_g1_i2.p1 TRINITY_DN827_c0_g1~~TRINITY_DN827_c0_g1_i2.p1  ORF type:complete len:1944 (+),score=85.16 TRINITY_DN827_c0_g1_i2:3283-9114(+)